MRKRKKRGFTENKDGNSPGDVLVNFIVERNKWIEKFFIVACIISAVCFLFVEINYDLSKYLPGEMESKQGIELMEKEFGYPGMARVMIKDVSVYEAKLYKDKIEALDGVDMISWLDSSSDIYQSPMFLDYEGNAKYYKDRCAIMDITFTEGNYSQETYDTIDEIKEIVGEKGCYGGTAVQNKFQTESLAHEAALILIMGTCVIFLILLLGTESWFEPVIFLLVIAVSIIINMGTNLIMGSISSITLSIAAILQLAIAMDYTIILLDNFTKERAKSENADIKECLKKSIKKSIVPIASAGSAAVCGFIVLVLMRYSIGKDIGLVLAKGILISLITVVTLMPAALLRWNHLVERFRHKPLVPKFDRVAKGVYKYRFLLLVLVVILTVPSFVGKYMTDYTFGSNAFGLCEGTEVYEDTQEMDEKFGRSNPLLVIIPNDSMVTEKLLAEELENLEYMGSVTSLAGILPEGVPVSFLPESTVSLLHTDNYSRLICVLRTSSESDFAFSCIEEVKAIVEKYYPEGSAIVGETPSTMDIRDVIVDDYNLVEFLSLVGVALAVILAFRNLFLPIALLIPIECAININMVVPYLMGDRILYMGYVIVSCLQLGATIDYSIVMTHHYQLHRESHDKRTASELATKDSCLPILISGLILSVAGYGVYMLSSITAIMDLGHLIGRGALLSILLVIGILPNLFVWFDKPIMATRFGNLKRFGGRLFGKGNKNDEEI